MIDRIHPVGALFFLSHLIDIDRKNEENPRTINSWMINIYQRTFREYKHKGNIEDNAFPLRDIVNTSLFS
jgi:hypothetical protein